MPKLHLRMDYDDASGEIDIKSESSNPWVDLQIAIQGVALIMAAVRKQKKMDPIKLSRYVGGEIDKVSTQRNGFTIKDTAKIPGFLLP